MADQRGAFEVGGDLSPRQLADRLGWPRQVVSELIEQGRISRTAAGWRIDVAAELRRRWARSLWDDTWDETWDDRWDDTVDPASDSESPFDTAAPEVPEPPRTEDDT